MLSPPSVGKDMQAYNYVDTDMHTGGVYIIRGLKVVKETQWSDALYSYAPRDDGRQEQKSESGAAVGTSEVEGHAGVGRRLSALKAKGTRCEVYSEGDWWQAKVLKNRVEEGREQVYVHYTGASADDDEWIDLHEDRIRAPSDDWDMPMIPIMRDGCAGSARQM